MLPPLQPFHSIGGIQASFSVFQKWPAHSGGLNVRPGEKVHVERDNKYLDMEFIEFCFVLPQLRQVRPASRSPQMPVKHQQRPVPAQILQAVRIPLGIWQIKWYGEVAALNRHVKNSEPWSM